MSLESVFAALGGWIISGNALAKNEGFGCILVFAAGNDDILSSVPPENRNASSIVVAAVDKNQG